MAYTAAEQDLLNLVKLAEQFNRAVERRIYERNMENLLPVLMTDDERAEIGSRREAWLDFAQKERDEAHAVLCQAVAASCKPPDDPENLHFFAAYQERVDAIPLKTAPLEIQCWERYAQLARRFLPAAELNHIVRADEESRARYARMFEEFKAPVLAAALNATLT